MRGVDYDKAKGFLPEYCLALMQNVPVEDQQSLVRALKDVEAQQAEASVKVLLLGLELINVVGVDVLTTAVKSLEEQIRSVPGA